MKSKNKITGKYGEELAVDYLKKKGFEILHTNWHASKLGEIDIIAKHNDTLIFVEVKTRSTLNFGHPFEAINPAKVEQIRNIASIYLSQNNDSKFKQYRFDAVSVILKPSIEISHLENIY